MNEVDSKQSLEGSYEIYKMEAEALRSIGDYKRAVEYYTKALLFENDDKFCLTSRSKCHLLLGDTAKALEDAEAAMVGDPTDPLGMFQKAEALFDMGDFETALVFYHRCLHRRPDNMSFRLGIRKAEEAIINCVGSPERVTLTLKGDLTFFEVQTKKPVRQHITLPEHLSKAVAKKKQVPKCERTIRQNLGELYREKTYMEQLILTGETETNTGQVLKEIAEESLRYLDTKANLWHQVKPIYAHKFESRNTVNAKQIQVDPHERIFTYLDKIDQLMTEARYKTAVSKCDQVIQIIDNYGEKQVGNKFRLKSAVHSYKGSAYFELGQYLRAYSEFQADLEIGEDYDMAEVIGRSLDNLGRTYAKMGMFKKAIQMWERKLPMSKSPLETTWLCHELGRCYLELSRPNMAKHYGARALDAAASANDILWQLHALVLISQSELRCKRLSAALIHFQGAYELACLQMDESAMSAIQLAIDDVDQKIADRITRGQDHLEDDFISEGKSSLQAEALEDEEITKIRIRRSTRASFKWEK